MCQEKKCKKLLSSSESSDEDSDFPSLSVIRSSKAIQKRVHCSLADLETNHKCQGNETQAKIKSTRGDLLMWS